MSDAERKNYEFKGTVKNVPEKFTEWVEWNKERAKGWQNMPYFIRDNNQYVNDFKVNVYSNAEKVFTRHGRTKEAMRVALAEELKKEYPELENTEMAAIYHYTQKYGSSFRKLNNTLRKGKPLDAFEAAFSELLTSGLSKLPPYKGEVYRAFTISKKGIMELCGKANANESVIFRGFSSSSISKDVAIKFVADRKGYSVLMHINSQNGKALKNLSMFNGKRVTENQYEVLFDKNTKMRIKKYSVDGKMFHIYADEI